MKRLDGRDCCSALPLSALAAEPVAPAAAAAAPVASSGVGGQLTQLVLGLLLVVGPDLRAGLAVAPGAAAWRRATPR